MAKRPKRPRDPNQLAKLILDIATGERPKRFPEAGGRDGDDEGTSQGWVEGREGEGQEAVGGKAEADCQEGRQGAVAPVIRGAANNSQTAR
jgi:hypothetical protein